MNKGEVQEQSQNIALYRLCTATEIGKIVAGANDVKILLHYLLH